MKKIIFTFYLIAISIIAIAQAPANDNCINAVSLTIGAPCTSGTTVNATFDGNVPSCSGSSNIGNVWYSFTATATISKIDVTNVAGFDPVLSIYNSCGGNDLQCSDLTGTNGNESVTFTTVIGTTYLINVNQYDASSGTFCVEVKNIVPPANDDCANAIALTVGNPCTSGTTVNSTFDGNFPSCDGGNSTGNVWYSFTATSTLSSVSLTNVSGLDAILSIYSSCGGNSVQCADDGLANQGESITFSTVIGTTYFINVKQYNASEGTFCVDVINATPPANDNCANAISLTVGNPCTSGTTVYSTFDGTTPSCGGASSDGNVWYSFTATSTVSKVNVTNVSGLDPVLAIYTSCGGSDIQCADATGLNGNESISFTTVIGTTYIINVKQYSPASGTFCIEVINVTPPANDDCANATSLTVGAPCTNGTTVNATIDGNLPACGGGSSDGNVWYSFTATATQSIVTITNVSGFDPVLSIYSTCGGNSTQCVDAAISNQGETILFSTVIGTTYLINVKQYDPAAGTFCIDVTNPIPPANDDCANAISLTVGVPCTNGTTQYATFDGNLPSCGGTSPEGNVWYSFVATSTTTKVDLMSVAGFDAVLSIYSNCGGNSVQCSDMGFSGQDESLIFSTVVGTTYLINVKQFDANYGSFCIAVSNIILPPNDDCANAISLTVGAPCTNGTTVNATFDGNLPSCGGTSSSGNVWYSFTATSTLSKVEVSSITGFDPVIAIHNTCGGNSIQCDDAGGSGQGESITFVTVVGTSYIVNVKQYDASSGTFCIDVNNVTPPPNDNCANAISLTIGAPCTNGTTVNATADGNIPSCGSSTSDANVWYSFTATSIISSVNVSNVNGLDVVLAIYNSCTGNSIHCADAGFANQGETVTFATTVGTTYLVNVKQYDGFSGTFCIDVNAIVPPANDSCSNAINLTVGAPCTSGTTVNSTIDGNIPSCDIAGTNVGNVWYSFTAATTQTQVDLTAVSGFDAVLAIYNACNGNDVQCADAGISNQGESINFTTVIGTTYLINVKQYDGADGTFCIAVNNNPSNSINEYGNTIAIYPNPATNILKIENTAFNGPFNVVLTNTLGQTVKVFTVNKNIETIDISDINTGTYFLQIPELSISKIISKQ